MAPVVDDPIGLGQLKKRPEFLRVAAGRRKWAMPGLVLQVAPRGHVVATRRPAPAADTIRVGYTASRKVGGAVSRNRAKRRLRAVATAVLTHHAATGTDYVMIARAGTLSRPYMALVTDLEEALRRLHVWRVDPQHPPAATAESRA